MRRWAAVALAILGVVLVQATPAAAHGVGARLDLPVPLGLFVFGAAVVVVVSFVALGILWKEPKLEGTPRGRPLPLQGLWRSRAAEMVVRTLSLAVFLVVLVAAAGGRDIATLNLAPWIVYIWFWVGMAFAHALFGNWWATLSPWDSIARFLGVGERARRPYPAAWGLWPAAIFLFCFVWLELVFPFGGGPRVIAIAMTLYTAITLTGMALFGRDTWNRHGESFAVYFRLLSLMAPFARDEQRRVILRPPLAGLPTLEPRPGLIAVIMVVIGSTIFDGFSGTTFWTDSLAGLGPVARTLINTTTLLSAIVLASGAYALSMLAASAIAKVPWHPLSVRFVHSLVPIAFAYVTAHYFSLLLLEGQNVIALASDPFGFGWNLFGTATFETNLLLLSAFTIWYVQVGAIVLGHVAGVLLAHDRALALFPPRQAVRTQYALLGVMVLFTMGGLLVLSAG